MKRNKYEKLMYKAESNWAWQFWQNVADKLKNMALSLPLEELVD